MRRLFAGIAALVALIGTSFAANATTFSLTVEVTPAGVASAWPTNALWVAAAGNFGFASAPPAISVATGASGSQNARSLLLSDPGTATIGITGCTMPTAGFSLGANGLNWSSVTATSQTCRYTALSSLGNFTAQSELFRVEAVAPASGDTQAPPIPRKCAIANGAGQITITCDESNDNYESDGDAPTGTTHYVLEYGGVEVATIPTTAGTPKQLAATTIGSHAGSPSSSQTGNNWQIVGDGDIDGTDDIVYGRMVVVSTDFTASVLVNSVTNNGNSFPKYGIMLRNTSATNSRMAVCHNQAGTDNQLRRRLSDGANTGSGGQATGAVPQELRVTYVKATGVLTCETGTDGMAYTALSSVTVATDSSPLVGLYVTGSGVTASTGNFQNWNLNQKGQFSYTYPTITSATARIKACDASQCSAFVTIGAGTPAVPADTTAPVISVQPTGTASGSASSINWTLGTWTDAGTIRGYIPTTYTGSTCSAGASTGTEQATNSYAQSGLSANTAYSLKSQAVDTAGNVGTLSNCATATTAASPDTLVSAPTISSATAVGTADPAYTIRITHSLPTGADHYLARSKVTGAANWYVYPTNYTGSTIDIAVGDVPGTTYDVAVAAVNAAGTTILWSTTSTAATVPDLASNAIKWHPGVYIDPSDRKCSSTSITKIRNGIAGIANDITSEIAGIKIRLHWSCLEGDTAGDYSAGFAIIDDALSRLGALAVPKRLILEFHGYAYGTCPQGQNGSPPTSGSVLLPQYIRDTGLVAYCHGNRIYTPHYWNPTITDRWIALSAAYAARYDTNPRFEMFQIQEETAVMDGSAPTFSLSAALTQWKRMITATQSQWTHTITRNPINYFGSDSQNRDLYDTSVRPGMVYGGPDAPPFAQRNISGNRQYLGQTSAGVQTWTSLRDTSPFVAEVQFGTSIYGTLTLQQLYDNMYSVFRPRYIVWYHNDWDGVTARYTAPMYTFVRAGSSPVYSTACPTGWTCDMN